MNVSAACALRALLLGAALGLGACKKDDDAPATGSISGRASPSDAIATVTATDNSGHHYTTTPTVDGFALRDVVPGAYVVRFVTGPSRYLPVSLVTPGPRAVTVAANGTTDLGTIQVWPGYGVEGGGGGCLLDGSPFGPDRLQGSQGSGGALSVMLVQGANTKLVELNLVNVTGPGTHQLGAASTGRYSVPYCGEWSTRFGGGGTARITSYSVSTRLVSGSFSFVARRDSTSQGNCPADSVSVTNGTFTDVPF